MSEQRYKSISSLLFHFARVNGSRRCKLARCAWHTPHLRAPRTTQNNSKRFALSKRVTTLLVRPPTFFFHFILTHCMQVHESRRSLSRDPRRDGFLDAERPFRRIGIARWHTYFGDMDRNMCLPSLFPTIRRARVIMLVTVQGPS